MPCRRDHFGCLTAIRSRYGMKIALVVGHEVFKLPGAIRVGRIRRGIFGHE
jgi:hypothetical protein